jgi:hypothetical protein
MYKYGNWKSDCSPNGGVVKALTKPAHGKISPRRETIMISESRFTGPSKCAGRQIPGFNVYYTSDPNYRGADSFSIEVSYPGFPTQIDRFSVRVE